MIDFDREATFEVTIGRDDVQAFAALTGDLNPLHVDPAYAATTDLGRPIAHGALLVGLVSRLVGMHLPGRRSLILSMQLSFPKPVFYPALLAVHGSLRSFDEPRGAGTVRVTIEDRERSWRVLEGDVRFSLHAEVDAPVAATPKSVLYPDTGRRGRLLVTGGTGGVGSALLLWLAPRHDVTCISRRAGAVEGIDYRGVDLEASEELERFLEREPAAEYSAILHLSAPPMARAFVSDDPAAVRRQLYHAIDVPLRLARWARTEGSGVRRMVLLGSTAGTRQLSPQLGAYSLAKAAMEHLCRLLAADLAAIGATVNVVAPSAMPMGLNQGMSERARRAAAGRVPTGRLTTPADIAGVVDFLLSGDSGQMNGMTIFVDGGELSSFV